MRRRGLRGWLERLPLVETRPVLAAVLASVITLALIGGFVATRTIFKTRTAATRPSFASRHGSPLPNPASGPYANPASGPYANPASAPYPPYGNPASGYYPPQSNPASLTGNYPPFYPPASNAGAVAPDRPIDCRLPVYAGQPGSGGFIVFPGGTFVADPGSSVTLPSPSPGSAQQGGPGGYGQGYPGLSYDRHYARWLPVPSNWVSPDGSHYAYVSDGLYQVNVATGAQTELHEGRTWTIAGIVNSGVYAGDQNAGGLWLFPFSGAARQISASGYWQAAGASAAYGTSTSAVPQGATNVILRLDLNTGRSQEWFTRTDSQSSIVGIDGKGNPIIHVSYLNNSGSELWIATSPGSASAISGFSSGYYSSGFNASGTPIPDSHGIWFAGTWSSYGGSPSGVALYVPGSGFYWMSSIGGQLGGGCY